MSAKGFGYLVMLMFFIILLNSCIFTNAINESENERLHSLGALFLKYDEVTIIPENITEYGCADVPLSRDSLFLHAETLSRQIKKYFPNKEVSISYGKITDVQDGVVLVMKINAMRCLENSYGFDANIYMYDGSTGISLISEKGYFTSDYWIDYGNSSSNLRKASEATIYRLINYTDDLFSKL